MKRIQNFTDKELINELHRREKCRKQADQKKIVLVGAPGAGKGTHAHRLIERYCLCQISTGDLLRKEIKEETELGKEAYKIISDGSLMPDSIMVDMVTKNIQNPECVSGAILDGFPRTRNQAKTFDEVLKKNNTFIDKVLYFKIDDEIVTERLGGRLIHQPSGRSYHVKYSPPQTPGIDDYTGEPLIQRNDDKEEIIRERLRNFHVQAKPLLDYYNSQGILSIIQANSSIKNVWRSIKDSLKEETISRTPIPEHPKGYMAKNPVQ